MTTLIYAPPDQASSALERMQSSAHPLAPDHVAAWRRYERARVDGQGWGEAAHSLAALGKTASNDELDSLLVALTSLDDRDEAFRLIAESRLNAPSWSTAVLFQPATAALRADRVLQQLW